MEVGGGRKLSKFSTVRWLYVVGLQVMHLMISLTINRVYRSCFRFHD